MSSVTSFYAERERVISGLRRGASHQHLLVWAASKKGRDVSDGSFAEVGRNVRRVRSSLIVVARKTRCLVYLRPPGSGTFQRRGKFDGQGQESRIGCLAKSGRAQYRRAIGRRQTKKIGDRLCDSCPLFTVVTLSEPVRTYLHASPVSPRFCSRPVRWRPQIPFHCRASDRRSYLGERTSTPETDITPLHVSCG